MPYAALISLAQTVDIILKYHQNSISRQVKDQITSIHEYVIFLQVFLEDFPDKANSFAAIIRAVTHVAEDIIELFMSEHIYEPRYAKLESSVAPLKSKFKHEPDEKSENHCCGFPDELTKSLLTRIMFFQHVAEDIVELFFREQFCRSLFASSSSDESCVGSSKSKFKHQPKGQYEHLRYDFHDLKEAREEIQLIAEMVMKMKNSVIVKDVGCGDSTAVSSSSRVASVHEDAMVGFENHAMQIKSLLCRESSKREVIPVVGLGGIGKTTLARNVYDDPLTKEHFQIRVWVTVSQDYTVKEIVSGLLISMKVFEAKNETMREELVYKNLKGRRYLIVLDDIWSVKAWDDLKMMFPDDGNGSRIMLTTRLLDVASYTNSSGPVHEMTLMDQKTKLGAASTESF